MKWCSLILVLFAAACDPGVSIEFLVNAAGDDSTAQTSTQIANALAQRHGLGAHPDSRCDLVSYHAESSPTRWWDLCVDHRGQNVSLVLEEWITTDWSPKGDSLQRELEDTLRVRFGDRVTRLH
jgi:hypothetical protein